MQWLAQLVLFTWLQDRSWVVPGPPDGKSPDGVDCIGQVVGLCASRAGDRSSSRFKGEIEQSSFVSVIGH